MRAVVSVLLVVLCLGLVGAGIWWSTSGRSGSLVRVMVALRGSVGPDYDPLLVDETVAQLRTIGFDAVAAPAPITEAGPAGTEQALDIADAMSAGYTVLLDLEVTRFRDGIEPGTALFDASLAATLLPTNAQPGTTLRSRRVVFAFERTSASDIAVFVRNRWVAALSSDAAGWIYEDVAFQTGVIHGSPPVEEMGFAHTLRENAQDIDDRNRQLARHAEYCARERDALAAQTAAEPAIQCVGDPCGQWTLIGVDARGRALAQDISRDPYFPILEPRISWSEPPESVTAIPLDGGEPEIVHRTGHFYGFGSTSPRGEWISLQPFGMRTPAVVVVPTAGDGEARLAASLGERERISSTVPHPAGRGALGRVGGDYYYFHDGERIVLPNLDTAMWLEREGQAPAIVGATSSAWMILNTDGAMEGTPIAITRDDEPRRADVLGRVGGELWAHLESRAGCELARLDLEHRTSRRDTLPVCLRSEALLADGRLVGVARMLGGHPDPGGHDELVLLDPDALTVTALTNGPLREEVVYVAGGDTPRIVFNRRLEDWPREFDLGIFRRVVCWTDVPPR